jgi:hypothetical protein
LEVTRGLSLLHPCVAASEPELLGKDDFEIHNYTISYEPIGCDRVDCSKCYAPIEILDEPQLFTIGKSRHDLEVLKINTERRQYWKWRTRYILLW